MFRPLFSIELQNEPSEDAPETLIYAFQGKRRGPRGNRCGKEQGSIANEKLVPKLYTKTPPFPKLNFPSYRGEK